MPQSPKHQAFASLEDKKKDAEKLRANIEKFVDGIMSEKYTLAELLNESFTMDMLELLFKRMTSRLRSILFARAKTLELIQIALDPTKSHHTRSIATSFVIVGGAGNSLVTCPDDAHRCNDFWDTTFDSLQREADGLYSASSLRKKHAERRASVAELEEIIGVEVKAIEIGGARSLKQSEIENAAANPNSTTGDSDHDSDNEDNPRTPSSARSDSPRDSAISPNGAQAAKKGEDMKSNGADVNGSTTGGDNGVMLPAVDEMATFGIFSADSANFASQILRYFAVRVQKGACILHFLADHPGYVDLLLSNIGHDDIRTLLLHLVYSDHSDAAIESLFATQMLHKMIQKLVTFAPPRTVFERDCIENKFLLLREVIHAPYLTSRGVAISAKTIPLDKVTGQDEYVSICGASREMANSSLRKYTSRKVRRLIHLFMQNHQKALEQLFVQMIKELTFWSTPLAAKKERKGSLASLKSLTLLSQGHPRPTCTDMLTHLFELTETVDFSDGGQNNGASSNSVTSVGIDCLNFMCSTHLMRTGKLFMKKKLKNEIQACQVSVNCMMGLRITSNRAEQNSRTGTVETGFTPNQGNQTVFTLDEIDSVESSDWRNFGFTLTVKKKKAVEQKHSSLSSGMGAYNDLMPKSQHKEEVEYVKTVEYFAASSEEEKQQWIKMLEEVISGDLNELEIFCSDDWRSNVREYRRLRECLITCMERKGHELTIYLKQVVVQGTRKASGYHLYSIVKCLNAVLSNESKRLDRMFVSAQVIDILLACYEKYPMWNLLLGEITKMIVFCFGDFKNKRSRKCPIIEKLMLSEGPDARLLPLLTEAFVCPEGQENSAKIGGKLVGTDALSNLKMLMESIKLCYKDPRTRSQERVQTIMKNDPKWQRLVSAAQELIEKDPTFCITSVPTPPSSTKHGPKTGLSPAPSQPAFQEDIINQISRPSYSTAHGFGSSFLLGDGCAFGYLFKERHGGRDWQKALMVYEYVSYKLWYFYPSEVDESHRIKWKWIIPLSVKARYTHGHDESHTSVGHHGLYITAYDHHQNGTEQTPTREMHFSVTKLEDRDLWKDVLSAAATTIHQLCADYSTLALKLKKKPDKKIVNHCQDPSCNTPFKLFRRPHSCKRCGKWMCGKCTEQRMSIPEVGLLTPVRHCRACFKAAGGTQAEVEPANLFRLSTPRDRSTIGSLSGTGNPVIHGVDGTMRNSLTNAELYELAHGMLSPRSLLTMNRRMSRLDSIDSPKNSYPIDEVDGEAGKRRFLSDEEDDDDHDISPYASPVSRRSLLHPKEDTRG
ncbi:zinc finger protein, partial [Globisporangium splendens]